MIYYILHGRIRSGTLIKESPANVWLEETGYRPERIFKHNSDFAAFDTFAEAKAELVRRIESTIARRENELKSKREDLAELKLKTAI